MTQVLSKPTLIEWELLPYKFFAIPGGCKEENAQRSAFRLGLVDPKKVREILAREGVTEVGSLEW